MQALGCLLYLLVTGKLPFQAEAKLQILNGDYTLPESGNPGVINLIRDLLQVRRSIILKTSIVYSEIDCCFLLPKTPNIF